MQNIILRAAFCLSIVLPLNAKAAEGDWLVAKATSQVRYSTDKATWNAVKAGMTIPNGAWMSTGPRARALLQRGVESVSFHPSTIASITTNSSRETEVVQPTGMLDLDIEKRSAPHTRVDTPFLAAIVKGTKFSVTVSKKTADVSVSRGLVNVRSLKSAQQSDVGPGQSASVGAGGGMHTSGTVSAPAISRVTSIFGFLGVPTTSALAGPAVTSETATDDTASSPASSADDSGSNASGQSVGSGKGAGGGDSQGSGNRGSGNAGNGGRGSGESRDKADHGKGPDGTDGPDKGPGQDKGPSQADNGDTGKSHDEGKGPGKDHDPKHDDAKGPPNGRGPGKPGGHGEKGNDGDSGEDAGRGGKGPDGKGDNKGQGKAKGRDK